MENVLRPGVIAMDYQAGEHKLKLCLWYGPPKTQFQLYFDRSRRLSWR